MAISVNILRWRVISDRPPRSKNGQPAHSTTGVLSTSCIQATVVRPSDAKMLAQARNKFAHRKEEDGHGQRQADPETARHVAQFGVIVFERGALR